MTKDEKIKNDYDAIVWAWGILKKFYEPKDDPDYWYELMHTISERDKEDIAYQQFGQAVANILDLRHTSMKRYGDVDHALDIHLEQCRKINEGS